MKLDTGFMGSMRRWALVLGGLIVVAVVWSGAFALATATSGRVYKSTIAGTRICTEAVIADVADNKGYTTTWSSTCSSTNSKPPGYLGVRIRGVRDGGFCSSWTGWAVNASTTWSMGLGGYLCTNPGGTQEFQTYAESKFWYSSGYIHFTQTVSPSQNY
jgi:hypothetical protein